MRASEHSLRNDVGRTLSTVVPRDMAALARHAPLRPLRRLLLLVAGLVILHAVSLFAMAEIGRLNPALFENSPVVARALCGEEFSVEVQGTAESPSRRRSLDGWLGCRDAAGATRREASRKAAWLTALGLSVPLGLLLCGVIICRRRLRPAMPR